MQDGGADLGIVGLVDAHEIGRGGFAVVYRASQPAIPREVAVKVLDVRPDAQTMARFSREVRAMVALGEHPAIVPLFDAGTTTDGKPYLVMPYLSSGSMQDALDAGERVGWPAAREIGIRLASALQAAHDQGILHRDIKPANVLRGRFGDVMLADFGIARVAGGHVTTSGVVTASIAYAAPEILEGLAPSPASDVYSLAATLYGLMAGRGPFESADTIEESVLPLLTRTLTAPLPAMDGVPERAMAVLHRAMDRDPAARPPSAAAFADALRAADVVQDGVPMGASSATAAPSADPAVEARPDDRTAGPAPADARRRTRRTRLLLPAVIAIILIGVVAGVAGMAATSRDPGSQEAREVTPRAALTAIYDATGGPGWEHGDGWTAAADPCTWHGIACADGRVTEIRLPGNGLAGDLPAEVGVLRDLQVLDLRDNVLSSLPAEVGDLTDLRFLDVGGNELETLPPEIGDLARLETLWAFDNRLTSLPPEIGRLTALHTINVDRNALSTLPAEIGDLGNLRNLDARLNRLTSLPPDIGDLRQLERLVVRINQLTALPAELGELGELRHLAVDENALTGDITAWAAPLASAGTVDELVLSDHAGGGNGCLRVTDGDARAWLDDLDPEWSEDCR